MKTTQKMGNAEGEVVGMPVDVVDGLLSLLELIVDRASTYADAVEQIALSFANDPAIPEETRDGSKVVADGTAEDRRLFDQIREVVALHKAGLAEALAEHRQQSGEKERVVFN